MCLRRLSLCVYSVTSAQASSRESLISTPQLRNSQRPSNFQGTNSQNSHEKKDNFQLHFLIWKFWEFCLGSLLGIGGCGVGNSLRRRPEAALSHNPPAR